MNMRDFKKVVLVYLLISAVTLMSGFIPSGEIQGIKVLPMTLSLLLLIPLFTWLHWYEKHNTQTSSHTNQSFILRIVLLLFALAMIVRFPMVLILGMSFEKTPVIFLTVLTIILIERQKLSDFGFKTERFSKALFTGLAYYLIYGVAWFSTFLGSIYLYTGQIIVPEFDIVTSLVLFPFMTICVGISEEGLFRGFMQTSLSKVYTEKKAILAQAFLFGVWHIVWHISPFNLLDMVFHVTVTFLFGLLFGIIFRLSRNLIPLIFAHGLVDEIPYGIISYPEVEPTGLIFEVSQLLSFFVSLTALYIFIKFLSKRRYT